MSIMMPTIIWLDSNSNNSNGSFLTKLRDFDHIETFTEVDSFIDYIKCHSEQPIFLIVSGVFALQVVPQIYESSNIQMIFVFCAAIKTYSDWAMDFCERLLMFDHEDDLLQRLLLQLEEYLREQVERCIKKADECKERARRLKQSCG